MIKNKRKVYTKYKARLYKGFPLVDATQDLEIEITKGDVSKADKKKPENCAAAVACKRMLNTEVEVHISRTYVKDNKRQCWIRFLTPESVGREITSFDRGSSFEIGTYNLKAPTAAVRLGVNRGKSYEGDKTTKKRRTQHITANIRESAK